MDVGQAIISPLGVVIEIVLLCRRTTLREIAATTSSIPAVIISAAIVAIAIVVTVASTITLIAIASAIETTAIVIAPLLVSIATAMLLESVVSVLLVSPALKSVKPATIATSLVVTLVAAAILIAIKALVIESSSMSRLAEITAVTTAVSGEAISTPLVIFSLKTIIESLVAPVKSLVWDFKVHFPFRNLLLKHSCQGTPPFLFCCVCCHMYKFSESAASVVVVAVR